MRQAYFSHEKEKMLKLRLRQKPKIKKLQLAEEKKMTTIPYLDVPAKIYEEIGKEIANDKSAVGIDAKKTHIIIINKLLDIEKRLERLEAKINSE